MKASESLQNHQSTATEKALRLAFEATPPFIHTARPDGDFDYFNRCWLYFLGKSLEAVCGWHWTESVHPEDVAGIVPEWHGALASGEPLVAQPAFDAPTEHIETNFCLNRWRVLQRD